MNKERNLVFISYASEDRKKVLKICEGFIKRGLNVWFDEKDMELGEWKPQIEEAINRSSYFVFCMSKNSLKKISKKRKGVVSELETALRIAMKQPKKVFTIVPVKLENCSRGDYRLNRYQQFDLFDNFEEMLDRLAAKFKKEEPTKKKNGKIDLESLKARYNKDLENLSGNYKMLHLMCEVIIKSMLSAKKATMKDEVSPDKKKFKVMEEYKRLFRIYETEIVNEIREKTGMSLQDAKKTVKSFIETVSEDLNHKGKVTLPGFGTYCVAHRKEKTSVNPKNGKKITIRAKDVPVVKMGKDISEMLK